MRDWQERDLRFIWHPCSQMKDYEEYPPIIISHGKGAYLYDLEGKAYLDAISSWWVNLFGHSNERINRALKAQADQLEHVIFSHFSHKPAIELAERLVNITPPGLTRVFFADNGSAAVEIALKMSFHYHQQRGETKRTRFAAISHAYHGETLGALSVGDIDLYSRIYKPLLLDTVKIPGPDCFRCPLRKERDTCDAECFATMEEMINTHKEELCAVIIEPIVQCAAGMKMYSPRYLTKLRALCDRHGLHFIADEIAVGFGRTGKMFACEHAGVSPDIMCLSKGISGGYLPLSVVLVKEDIYRAFYGEYKELKAFLHSHSYTGNALACACALETLRIFEEEDVLGMNEKKARLISELARPRAEGHPHIGEFRQTGMICAIEIVQDRMTKAPFDWTERVGYNVYRLALSRGVILRPLGDVIYFMPPYCVEEKDIELMVEVAFSSIDEYFRHRGKGRRR
ncbi:MAG TPA: adenosylmethionine--8-amino-7-oxononanoate transaminase [Syntrophales bacterium]|nr:adenosylmethionine--8-amino-7-oxononanoate transaminase [Syntrophales bacterium]HOL58384.1 adenosylmethionine--8-amino-7-oxononanoate transaminase [Syntrophales bacterium]HPO34553.1 adenosylmethionine--8-amino-7-oxononanoate transaminase [Syntrophales bacterium]